MTQRIHETLAIVVFCACCVLGLYALADYQDGWEAKNRAKIEEVTR